MLPPELLLNSTSALGLLLHTGLLTEMQDWRTAYIMLQTANCQPAPPAACPWVWQVLKPQVSWDHWLPDPGNCSGGGVSKRGA